MKTTAINHPTTLQQKNEFLNDLKSTKSKEKVRDNEKLSNSPQKWQTNKKLTFLAQKQPKTKATSHSSNPVTIKTKIERKCKKKVLLFMDNIMNDVVRPWLAMVLLLARIGFFTAEQKARTCGQPPKNLDTR